MFKQFESLVSDPKFVRVSSGLENDSSDIMPNQDEQNSYFNFSTPSEAPQTAVYPCLDHSDDSPRIRLNLETRHLASIKQVEKMKFLPALTAIENNRQNQANVRSKYLKKQAS